MRIRSIFLLSRGVVFLLLLASCIMAILLCAKGGTQGGGVPVAIAVAQIIVQLMIAAFVAYYINSVVAAEGQKRQLLLHMVNQVENKVTEAFQAWEQYADKPTKQGMEGLLYRYKRASASLTILITQANLRKVAALETPLNDVKLSVLDMKMAWTDVIYPERVDVYSSDYFSRGLRAFDAVLMRIAACKLSLFD